MKEELQGKLVEILTSIQTAAGKASDFAMEQLPDIAQSYVMYGRAWSLVLLLMCVALLVCCALAIRWACHTKDDGMDGFLQFMAGMTGGIGVLVSGVLFFVSVNGAMLVWFAPKVWLLKEIASLLK